MGAVIYHACAAAFFAQALPVDVPPEIELAREVAAAVGPTTKHLQLEVDASISSLERERLSQALSSTGLFILDATKGATHLQVARVDRTTVQAMLVRVSGERIWHATRPWASEPHRDDATATSGALDQYARERLSLRRYTRTFWGSKAFIHQAVPIFLAPDPERKFSRERLPSMATPQLGWEIVRGDDEILDDFSFAERIGDNALQMRVEEERHGARTAWVAGFGGAALVLGGLGSWLMATSGTVTRAHCEPGLLGRSCVSKNVRDDRFAWGLSAASVAVASAIGAAFFHHADPEHHIDSADAQLRIGRYNAGLRRRLGVTSDDTGSASPE